MDCIFGCYNAKLKYIKSSMGLYLYLIYSHLKSLILTKIIKKIVAVFKNLEKIEKNVF